VSKLDQRRATAYHEAGHVVAAIIQGIRLGRKGTSIIPDVDSAGRAHIRKGFKGNPEYEMSGSTRLGAERRAIVSLAGEAAQRKFRPSSIRRYHAREDGIMLSIS
jgi:hypothetical protein